MTVTDSSAAWIDRVLAVPYAKPKQGERVTVQLVRQDYEQLEINRSIIKTPLMIGTRGFEHGLADYLKKQPGLEVRTATLDEPEHGLTDEVLESTDVMTWWGHTAHGAVQDEIVEKVKKRVLAGMGLIVLHSGHFSKIFRSLMGTTCDLKWREIGEKERLWVIDPAHPIAEGLPEYFEIPHAEMYGERFDIPQPDELVLISWFEGGEVFRSGCCFHRGRGKIFYFRPGHETYPIYYQEEVLKVIANGVKWAAPLNTTVPTFGHREPIEDVQPSE